MLAEPLGSAEPRLKITGIESVVGVLLLSQIPCCGRRRFQTKRSY